MGPGLEAYLGSIQDDNLAVWKQHTVIQVPVVRHVLPLPFQRRVHVLNHLPAEVDPVGVLTGLGVALALGCSNRGQGGVLA